MIKSLDLKGCWGGLLICRLVAFCFAQKVEIPPTAVGGCFRSYLQRVIGRLMNPTNGSWWIVQFVSKGSDKIILREHLRSQIEVERI